MSTRKVIIPLFVGLVILIFLTIFLPLLMRTKTPTTTNLSPTITTQPPGLATGAIDSSIKNKLDQTLPYETNDFKIEYSPLENKVVATKKTTQAEEKIDEWLTQNNLSDLVNKPAVFVVRSPVISPAISPTLNPTLALSITPVADQNAKLLVDLLAILLQITVYPSANNQNLLTPAPTELTTTTPKLKKTPTPKLTNDGAGAGNFVYYPQCGGSYDSYALPSGCTLCQAGCGPTTVAMITASYVDKTITPKTIVDLYKQKGYLLGCAGSRYGDAKSALASYGLKTTDYIISSYSSPQTIDQAAAEMKKYLANGWTIFALANFCDGGCGHFFWITDIGDGNATWAYDPYYGRLQKPPYNEKSRYPFPKYKIAFGVKK